jgi:ABC-type nitrate/sulfonate/bicarbonate transport system substrate-binding protein
LKVQKRHACLGLFPFSVTILLVLVMPKALLSATPPMHVGYSSINGMRIPLWVGEQAKIFSRHGLDVRVVHGGAIAPQAFVAGEIQIFSGAPEPVITAALRGADAVVIAGLGSIDFRLVALPNIQTAQQLKGKRVGVSRFGTFTYFAARRIISHLGLDPEKDVTLIQTGSSNSIERVQMLFSGTIDATLAEDYDIRVARIRLGKEMSVIGSLVQTGRQLAGGDLVTTRSYARQNSDGVRRFLMAVIEAVHVSRAQKDLVDKVVSKHFRENDKRILDAVYKTFVVDTFPHKPYPNVAVIEGVLDNLASVIPAAKDKKAADFIDSTFMEEIDRSGFIDGLSK